MEKNIGLALATKESISPKLFHAKPTALTTGHTGVQGSGLTLTAGGSSMYTTTSIHGWFHI